MKTSERLKEIQDKIESHPDYKKVNILYHKAETVDEHYYNATNSYYPGQADIPFEDRYRISERISFIIRAMIKNMELMKALFNVEDDDVEYQLCSRVLKTYLQELKKSLLQYQGIERTRLIHAVIGGLCFPYKKIGKYDVDGFLSTLLEVQIKKIKMLKKKDKDEGLRYFYTETLSILDQEVFNEDEIIPAAIILYAYRESEMYGMKNLRYFINLVSNEMDELADHDVVKSAVTKLISQDYIRGKVDGPYNFFLYREI